MTELRDRSFPTGRVQDKFREMQRDMGLYSARVIGLKLHPYQVEWCNYILNCVAEKRGEMITVTMARQTGKNEGSAQLEVCILTR